VTRSNQQSRFPTIDDTLVDRVVERIRAATDPEAILLFGSAARGETHAESDLDLVVVMELGPDGNPRDKTRQIHRLFSDLRVPMDIVVLSPEQFDEGQNLPGHIARVATRHGETLYERSA
jgi:predicted nucleotidyltransferase